MDVHVCSTCGAKLAIRPHMVGKKLRCPRCNNPVSQSISSAPAGTFRPSEEMIGTPAPLSSGTAGGVRADVGGEDSPRRQVRASQRAKRTTKSSKDATGARLRVLLVVAGVAALVLFQVGFIAWLVSGTAKDLEAGTPGEVGSVPTDVGPVTIAAAPTGKSWLTERELLDSALPPEDWAVEPDAVLPIELPARLLFNAPSGVAHVLQFAAPGTGRAAFVVRGQGNACSWVRYDLRKPPYAEGEIVLPATSIGGDALMAGDADLTLLDLSPDGHWLAGAIWTPFVSLWGQDGLAAGRFYPGMANATEEDPKARRRARQREPDGHRYTWIAFTDANHLALLTDDKVLEVRDVPSGDIESRTPVEIQSSAMLTPGRKCLVGYTGTGFCWLNVPGWKPVGTLRLPAKMPAGLSRPSLAISPDGERFAACFAATSNDMVLTWDVSTGKLRDARIILRDVESSRLKRQPSLQWTGQRMVLLDGMRLVDLDLGATVYSYWGMTVRGAPDERVWQRGPGVPGATDDAVKKARAKLLAAVKAMGDPPADAPESDDKRPPRAADWDYATPFFASRLPYPALIARLEALLTCPMLHPQRPIRAEVATAGPDEFREKVAAKYAASVRAGGFTVDPNAPVAQRLTLERPIVEHRNFTSGKFIAIQQGTGTPMGVDATMVVIRGNLSFIDSKGRVAWTQPAGDAMYGIKAELEHSRNLETSAPEAVAAAREAYVQQYFSHQVTSTNGEVYGNVTLFEQGKPRRLPLTSKGLPLDGVFQGELVTPVP
jgi:hypothetical protein